MKIKNLDTYIEKLILKFRGFPTNTKIEEIGQSTEPLFNVLTGSLTELSSFVRKYNSFAKNPQEQLFYECIQNAYDSGADSSMFFWTPEFLLVVNNGRPFYTDTIFDKELEKKGQFYRFLGFNASSHIEQTGEKTTDIGNYGQGAKLIFSMLADNIQGERSEDSMTKAIVNDGRSPYLISWSNRNQYDTLMAGMSEYEHVDDLSKDNLIFCKIYKGYYPLIPGQKNFTFEEAKTAVSNIKTLIPLEFQNIIDSGTAILIPLGKGKYEDIIDAQNLQNIKSRSSIFLSLYKDKRLKGKNLKSIILNGEYLKSDIENVSINSNIYWGNKVVDATVSFEKGYIDDVNLFKALPIISSKLGMGFVIDTKEFDTDDARQNLKDAKSTALMIKEIFKEVANEIKKLDKSSIEFKKICEALLYSNVSICNKDYDKSFIVEPFNEYFLPLLKESIPTTDEGFETLEKIWYSDTALPVSPQTLGIDKKLVSKEVVDLLKENHNINVENTNLTNIVEQANEECLKKYILELNDQEYKRFIELAESNWNDQWKIKKIFRSNQKKVYSFDELMGNTVLFSTDNSMTRLEKESGLEFIEIEFKQFNIKTLFNKIKSHPEHFRETVNTRNLACYILNQSKENPNEISKIALLKSKKGEYLPFNVLFSNDDNKKSIYSEFLVDGIVPQYAQPKWFCQDWKAWVRNNADKVKDISDWDKCHSIYVEEIIDAYKDCSFNNDSYFPLYLDDNNLPTTEQKSLHNADLLSDKEYKTVTSLFNDTSFLNIAYRKILSKKPFKASLNNISIDGLIEEDVEYDLNLVSIFFKLDQHLLKKFSISKINENFTFQSKDSKINILDAEGLTNEQKKLFIEVKGVFIPKEIETLISDDEKERCSPFIWNENTPLYRAVTQTQDPKELFSLIIKSKNYEAIESFLKRIKINIEDKITNHDIRWKIIMYSIENQNFIQLTRNCITVNGESLPQNITERYITCNGTRHDIYELLDAVRSDNAIISNLEDYLSSPMMDIFKNAYYKNKIALESECIFNKLIKDKLTLKQFVFCMDYAKETKKNEDKFKLDKETQIPEALQLISKKEYKGFEKLLYIPEYYDIQVYAKEEIILKEERLPQVLIAWIKGDEKNLSLFNSIWKESDSLIQLRRDILEDKKWTNPTIKDKGLIERTTEWLLSYNKDISFKSNSFDAINCYADNLKNKDADKDIVLLQLLPKVDNNQKLLCKIVKMPETNENDTYYIYENEAMQIQDLMKKGQKEKIIPFLNDNKVLIIPSKEFAGKYSITKDKTINISQQPDIQDAQVKFEEWSKKSGITIYITTQNVSTSVFFKVGDKEICQIPCKNSTDGYVEDKYIVIKDPRPEKKIITVLKELCDRSEYRWFHKHCIDLLSMILDGIISEKDHITTNSSDNPSNGGQNTNSSVSNNGTNGKGTGSGNISVKEENKDLLKYLDSWDKDLLTWIKENPKKIKQLQETGESQIKKICGYLGEQLYLGYMNKKNIKIDDVTDKNFADFKIENGEYVDVKTNIGTMKSEPKPIHIHKETQKYLNETSNNKLLIFHISLQDVGMETDYRRLEAKYGKDADPRKDVNLKEECDKLANEYWKNKTLEDFKKETSEYILSTPIKKS